MAPLFCFGIEPGVEVVGPAAARHFDSDNSGGLLVGTLQGARGGEGAPALPVFARGCRGL